jgi:hypothetical protein
MSEEAVTEVTEAPEKTIHQDMMDKAYELWNDSEESKKLSYSRFLDKVNKELGENYFYAVITGNMNYQVENGGWRQWESNRYNLSIGDLIRFFNQDCFKKFEEMVILSRLLDDVEELFEWYTRGKKEIDRVDADYQDLWYDMMLDSLDDKFNEELDSHDQAYYDIGPKVMEILEKYFVQKNLDEINGESNK